MLATGSADGTVNVFPAVPATSTVQPLNARLCSVVRRNLTASEWREFVSGSSYAALCPGYQG